MKKLLITVALFVSMHALAQDAILYKTPPKEIMDLVLAPPTPSVSIDNIGEWMLLMERSEMPTIEELAEPELRIAGLRINPENFGPSRANYVTGFSLKNIKTGESFGIDGLPDNLRAADIRWSPDEKKIGFINSTDSKISLWKIDIAGKKAAAVTNDALNAVMGPAYYWIGNDAMLYKAVLKDISQAPKKPRAPNGPIAQENLGKKAASRTYQDLIKNPYDEALFEFYAASQVKRTDAGTVGSPAIYSSIDISPDTKYILIEKINKPFSYLVPARGFPTTIEIVDAANGTKIKTLANDPSAESAPIGFDDVVNYARNYNWRSDKPGTLYYVKALDNGLGKENAEYRDAVYTLEAPFNGEANQLVKTKMRFRGITWGNAKTALLYEGMRSNRKMVMNLLDPSTGNTDMLYERRTDDGYADIGSPVTVPNEYHQDVLLLLKNNQLLLNSQGASAEGDMPLLQTFDLKTKKTKELWRCQAPYYESVISVIDPNKMLVVTSKESITETPNYYLRDLKKNETKAISSFKDPQPALRELSKEKISYKRKDGVDLTATLYLPKGYNKEKDGLLPVLIWAYPREYKSAADAAQVRGSQYRFTRINYGSPIFWALQGYAVMDGAEMPIVGEADKEPNDNFIPQLQLNAEAAINKVKEMGVGDPNRVAVGGHSYGAFMTANLLAHTKLFKAGIARSGAYNRTLTPFGFQAEERTYWEAKDVYDKMSPFTYADKIKTPLLMIHGEADNNSGTFPIQSERLYNAIKGHGGTARLVFLPYESHGYAAKENILHMLYEQNTWLDKYVKNADSKTTDDKKGF